MTDQPGQESRGGESGPGTSPMAPVPPEQQQPGQGQGQQQPGWGQGSGPGTGPADRSGLLALWMGGGALLLMFFLPPVSLALALGALYMGIRARRRARRAQTQARGAVAGIILGSIGLALSVVLVTTQIVFRDELGRYVSCREASNTITDEQVCKETFFRDIEQKLNLREGSLKRYDLPM